MVPSGWSAGAALVRSQAGSVVARSRRDQRGAEQPRRPYTSNMHELRLGAVRRLLGIAAVLGLLSTVVGGCSFLPGSPSEWFSKSSTPSGQGAPDASASFSNGAVDAWSMSWADPFPAGERPVVHPYMAVAFGPSIVFGSYGDMIAVDSATGESLWTLDGVDSIHRCAADPKEGLLLCPVPPGEQPSDELVVIDVETGKTEPLPIEGIGSSAGEVKKVDDTLVLCGGDQVSRIDMNGRVLWQQEVQTEGTETQHCVVTADTVEVREPSVKRVSALDLETGKILKGGESSEAEDFADTGNPNRGRALAETLPWAADGRFGDAEDCLFQLDGAVLFAPDNCYTGDTSGVVTAYDPASGEPLWEMPLTGSVVADASGQDLITVQGLERSGSKGFYRFRSVTAYRGAMPGEATVSVPTADATESGVAAFVPAQIPECPESTVRLSWAELPGGWALVCGRSEREPVLWMSQLPGASEVSSRDVAFVAAGDSPSYEAIFPSGSIVRISYDSPNVEVVKNTGDIKDGSGSQTNQLPITIIYFINLGAKRFESPTPAATPSAAPEAARPPQRVPAPSQDVRTTPAPSSAYCPGGTTPYFEGETEGFFISICEGRSGYTYVGYSPSVGEMILPAENQGSGWWASTSSHGYSVSGNYLDVYDLGDNENILHEPFIWTRQY